MASLRPIRYAQKAHVLYRHQTLSKHIEVFNIKRVTFGEMSRTRIVCLFHHNKPVTSDQMLTGWLKCTFKRSILDKCFVIIHRPLIQHIYVLNTRILSNELFSIIWKTKASLEASVEGRRAGMLKNVIFHFSYYKQTQTSLLIS